MADSNSKLHPFTPRDRHVWKTTENDTPEIEITVDFW